MHQHHPTRPVDLHAVGAVDQLLAFHRARFGHARMENDGATGTDTAGTVTGDAGTGTGDAGTGTGTAETGTAATAAADAQGTGSGDAAKTWNPDAWDGKVESLPQAAQKIITDLRKAEGDERVAKKTLDKLLKVLNPDAEGEKPDPVKLAQDLTTAQAERRQTAVELAVYKTASKHSGDPDALLDSRAFLAKVKDLDPAADDFASQVDQAIKSAVADNPKLKTVRVAGQSSVDHAGGSGEGDHTLDAQIAEAEKAGNHALAITLKRQKAYGVRQ